MRPSLFVAPVFLLLSVPACTWRTAGADAGPGPEVARDAEEGEEPDAPDAALAWRMQRWRDENGAFDPARVAAARAQRDANAAYAATHDDAGVGRFAWTERGPFNIGGRTRSLVVNPGNASELWAGAVGGGIWHSTNGGASWAPIDDWFQNLAVCSLALVPGSPHVLYAGTGEGFFNGDGLAGAGILKSTDGGATFQLLPATASFRWTNRIAVHPANPSVVLASVRGSGVWRSTDAGATWALVYSAQNSLQVAFDPNDASKAVADVYDGVLHKAVWSTNAGATFQVAATGLVGQAGISGRIELCYARSVPGMVYASCGTGGGLVWRSSDGGQNWTQRTTGTGTGAAWYYNSLWVDPTDANLLVVGAYHVYRSTDGGTTLAQVSNGYINNNGPHPDVHQFVADPGYDGAGNRRVYVTTDGGVYFTADIRTASTTSGWSRRDTSYRASQFYGAAGDGVSGRLTGGTQDNGWLTLPSAATSALLTAGGDGGFAAIDWLNPNYLYGEYVYATMERSSNGGTSSGNIYNGITDANSSATSNFIAPFVLDPNDPTRLLVGCAQLWRTSNARTAGVSWTSIKPAVGSNISAIAVAPGNANVIWIGHNDGRVFRTANGLAASPTWTAVDDNAGTNPLPNRYVNRILIDRGNSSSVWVAFGGFAGDDLQHTTDNGLTFADATGGGFTGLPDAPVYGLAQHPTLLDHLYAGTEVGLFASADGGLHWSTSNDGPADVSCEEVTFVAGTTRVLLATHGRGLWTIDVREPVVADAGAGCAGSQGVPVLTASPPRLGAATAVGCSNVPAGAFTWLVLGFSNTTWNGNPLPLALDGFGLPGCRLFASVDLTASGAALGGTFALALPLSANPATLGSTFWLQALALDPPANAGGAVVSNALRLTVGN